jgi:hypothetical protein
VEVSLGPSPEPHLKAIREYIEAGFDHLILTQIGPEQDPNHWFGSAGSRSVRRPSTHRKRRFRIRHRALPSCGRRTARSGSGNRLFSDLPKPLQERFNAFQVSVAEIIQGDNSEVRHLFARLQMGVPLNPAELRNAMLGPMRHTIDTVATSHIFFTESRIPDNRYKRQDFVAHAIAMAAYGGARDIRLLRYRP